MNVRREIRDAITLDFETEAIEDRPCFPPKPVGLAIRYPDGNSEYAAWGHPTGNNASEREVREWIREEVWRSDAPLVFHNGKFDLTVFYEKWELPMLPWERVHDTMFLAFLLDPHAQHLDLKTLADEWLDWPPEEKDAIAEYVWDNRRALTGKYGGKITRAKYGPTASGAWISKCPVKLIGPYAIGDVDRTYELFEYMLPIAEEYDLLEAYDRERRVLPILIENERDGVHVDLEGLDRDIPRYQKALQKADDKLRRILRAPDLNIDADAQLAEALSDAGVIDDDDWVLTKTGQKSVSKENLTFDLFQNDDVARLLNYRNRLTTALNTFMVPWFKQAEARNGVISTNWNQVRGTGGGTRSGRPSTYNPNFLNIPKQMFIKEDDPLHWLNIYEDNKFGLPTLPFVRYYVLADPGHVFLHRDFDGQEMRIFAHYEDGPLMEAYQRDPSLDPHDWVRQEIEELVGLKLIRTHVKNMNFLGLYGGGAPAAANKLGCSLAKAKEYKKFHDEALPGRQKVNDTIEQIVREGDPIRTWGGRIYYPEPPKVIKGRMQTFLYKLINYLCQGSAADVTKEALCRWYYDDRRDARFLVTVYDEINISAAEDAAPEQMALLRKHMEGIEMDVLMKSSGKAGSRWGELEKCD